MATLAFAVTLGGCSYQRATTGMAVDYNDFVAQTTNRQTVLNILRASQREPMHFTSFSEVDGTVRGQAQIGVNVAHNGRTASTVDANSLVTNRGAAGDLTSTALTAGEQITRGAAAANVSPNLGLMVSTGTDFKIAANATDEFYKGILTSIPTSVIVSYIRQGFPRALLSHLLIGRLVYSAKITEPGKKPYVVELAAFDNTPDNGASDFSSAIQCRTIDYSETDDAPEPIIVDDLKALGALTQEQLAQVTRHVDEAGKATYAYKLPSTTSFGLAMSVPETGKCDAVRKVLSDKMEAWAAAKLGAPSTTGTKQVFALKDRLDAIDATGDAADEMADMGDRSDRSQRVHVNTVRIGSANYFKDFVPGTWTADLIIDMNIRSVEGVLYYLGEYIRHPTTSPRVPCTIEANVKVDCPILTVLPAAQVDAGERFVEVSYRGHAYAVPISGADLNRVAGRSSQTIDLVQQLLNLNRSSKDLPSTPLVRVLN